MKTALLLFVIFASAASAQETCKLQTYASSWMATGTPFSVKCPSGVYTGTLVSRPARHFFHRGQLILKFDQSVAAVAPKNSEGIFRPGHGQQIASMLLSGGSGIGAKDITDGLSGVVFKSWYMIPITFGSLAFFEKGGDVNLKPGFELHLIATRSGANRIAPQ